MADWAYYTNLFLCCLLVSRCIGVTEKLVSQLCYRRLVSCHSGLVSEQKCYTNPAHLYWCQSDWCYAAYIGATYIGVVAPWTMDHGPHTMECATQGVTLPPPIKVTSRQKRNLAHEIQIAEFHLVSHDDCAMFHTIDLQHATMDETIQKVQRLVLWHQFKSCHTNRN